MSLRLHSFFVTSPLITSFDHNGIFDDYTEKNLLILVGPLSQVQLAKILKIKDELQEHIKVLYIEMLFEDEYVLDKEIDRVDNYLKDVIDIDKHLISNFITLENISQKIKELA